MKKPLMKIRKRMILIATIFVLLILLYMILMGMPAGGIFSSPSETIAQNDAPSGDLLSNEYVCSHYFSLLADELDRSETPFRAGEYGSFNPGPPATVKRHFVSSGIYLPFKMETTNGTAVLYTIVAYWLTSEGELKEDLVTLGFEFPDGEERFFLDDPVIDGLQAARASMKPGVVFTTTLTGFVSQHGPDWAGCPSSDFADRYGEQTCLVGAALTEENPPEVSRGFIGSSLFGWQLKKTGEMIPFPICQYIEES